MTYAIVKNSEGQGFIVNNIVKNANGDLFTIANDVNNSDGDPFTIFSDTVSIIPIAQVTFVAIPNRKFVA